jgi:hypothetical protein
MTDFLLFASERYGIPVLQPLAQALVRAGHVPYWFGGGKLRGTHLDGAQTMDSIAAVRALRPRAVFVAANSVPHFLPGAKVQLFHGFNVEKRDGSRGHFRVRGMFDLYCTQGPATTAPFTELARQLGHFAVVETGWTKLDPLFAADDEDFAGAANGRPVVLYATTFTERLSSAPALHAQIEQLVARGDRYWLLSLHPKCPRELIERYRALAGPHARFVEPEELVRAERAAQLLVCDTSSVIAECVVQGKPVVTFRNRAPQPWMIDIGAPDELDIAIERALHADAGAREALAREAERIHPWRDGRSSERVIAATQALLEGRLGALKPKPANLWRKLQMRWDWRWFGRAD